MYMCACTLYTHPRPHICHCIYARVYIIIIYASRNIMGPYRDGVKNNQSE